ncbi:G patch domain and ankyrin repeat-containing protein 1 [Aplochiton taeniatus]
MTAMGYFTPAKEEEIRWNRTKPSNARPANRDRRSSHEGGERRSSRDGRGHGGANATSSTSELQGLKLLRCAQEGNLTELKDLLSRGVDINFQDTFFWTAMMCASSSGQRAAVRLLLQKGAAWVGVVDTQGRDARELALTAGHRGVLEELDSYGQETQHDTQLSGSDEPQWCDTCACRYSGGLSSHLSSTLHQFSLRRPDPSPHYCLPPSSTSYQMMVRSGWNPGAGLGPEGGGPRQPIPTVLKRDQKGLGFGPSKRARVTHFKAKDSKAVKQPPKDTNRGRSGEQRKVKGERWGTEQREKLWERDFRNSFHL